MESAQDKVGSSPDAAKEFGGKGDFGAKESDRIEREYASRATKSQDRNGAPAHATGDGQRVSGVGSNESGPGSGSGGDLDPDVVGVGTGAGVAASGSIHSPAGADTAQETTQRDERRVIEHGVSKPVQGTTFSRSGGDLSTTGDGQGAAAVSNPMATNDDAFAGEISNGEAAGADNSPSDNK